ncbi:MAG: cytidylate kinase-like family protein [Lachnospiraceae bacterium]|nr:cytidylate kinase-like family protein [Lachnospiraceae bacterium]
MTGQALPVITINREYGAGGRALAAVLSKELDIPYYDRDFVAKTMEESGFDEEDIEREGEELSKPSRVLNDLLNSAVSYSSSHDAIFKAEKKVILKLAESPCILVGRCADHIIKEAGIDTVSVYLHAPREKRLKRTEELAEYGKMKPEKYMEERDSKRRNYYKYYTGREITDASNYTFCFDVGKVSIPLCAQIIIDTIKNTDRTEGKQV